LIVIAADEALTGAASCALSSNIMARAIFPQKRRGLSPAPQFKGALATPGAE
jgi:hypothetical protein